MCGRIALRWGHPLRDLFESLGVLVDGDAGALVRTSRYNVPPTSDLAIVTAHADAPRLSVAHWGFPIPKRPGGVFNTRVETAATSPLWAPLYGRSHGVVPVTGFYEWQVRGKQRVPHFIQRRDGRPLLLAALHDKVAWQGRTLHCTSLLTCAPNPLLAEVHDRMPVVLEESDVVDWLHPGQAGRTADLAVPAGDVLMMHEVSSRVDSVAVDDAGLMDPVRQQRLF